MIITFQARSFDCQNRPSAISRAAAENEVCNDDIPAPNPRLRLRQSPAVRLPRSRRRPAIPIASTSFSTANSPSVSPIWWPPRLSCPVGQELSATEVSELLAKDAAARATNAAINLLASRPRSTRELEQRLRQKGYAPDAISAALSRLAELHYVDDADFARYWVANRQANRPRGRRLLEQELRHKGVERELIAEAIDDAEIDEPAAALEAGRAKLRTYSNLEPEVARRRLAAYLGRRGYTYDTIRGALTQLFRDDEAIEDGE